MCSEGSQVSISNNCPKQDIKIIDLMHQGSCDYIVRFFAIVGHLQQWKLVQ